MTFTFLTSNPQTDPQPTLGSICLCGLRGVAHPLATPTARPPLQPPPSLPPNRQPTSNPVGVPSSSVPRLPGPTAIPISGAFNPNPSVSSGSTYERCRASASKATATASGRRRTSNTRGRQRFPQVSLTRWHPDANSKRYHFAFYGHAVSFSHTELQTVCTYQRSRPTTIT